AMAAEFTAEHRRLYSFASDAPLVVESVSVESVGGGEPGFAPPGSDGGGSAQGPADGVLPGCTVRMYAVPMYTVPMYTEGRWQAVPRRPRSTLQPGDPLPGPAIVVEDGSTTVVDPGWVAEAGPSGHLVLRRRTPVTPPGPSGPGTAAKPDPVLLEIFANLFM